MKKIFSILFVALMAAVQLFGQVTKETSGSLSVSKTVSVNPGYASNEETYFTVSYNDNETDFYTAYQMDIYLPEGMSFAFPNEDTQTYAALNFSGGVHSINFTTFQPSHSLDCAIQDDGCLRVLVSSNSQNKLKAHSGALFNVFVKASSYATPGDFTISIKGIKFVTPSEDKYLYADQENLNAGTIGDNAKLDLKVTAANKIGTGIFPFDCALPDGLEAYTCTGEDGDYLKLSKASSIAAFTPYILYSENGYNGTLAGTTIAADYPADGFVSDDYLTGVLKTTEVSSGYILQNQDGTPKFYRVGATPFSLPAGKCYCSLSSLANVPAAFRIRFDESSGINGVASDKTQDNVVYDLQGREVHNPQPGNIYIVNGEKFIKK